MAHRRILLLSPLALVAALTVTGCTNSVEGRSVQLVPSDSAAAASTVAEVPTFSAEPLPSLPDAETVNGQVSHPASPTAPVGSAENTPAATVSKSAAAATVLNEVPNGTVLTVKPVQRAGYKAWKVTLGLPTGGTMTGYVDRASGVVFLWEQTAPPPTVVTTPTDQTAPPQDNTEHENEEHENEYEDD